MKAFFYLMLLMSALPILAQGKLRFGEEIEGWSTEAGLVGNGTHYEQKQITPSLGLLVQYGPFSLKLAGTTEVEYDSATTLFWNGSQFYENGYELRYHSRGDFNTTAGRKDMELTLGYSWPFNVVIFGGYKKLEFSETWNNTFYSDQVDIYLNGEYQDSSQNYVYDVGWVFENQYDFKGYFLGLGYGFQPVDGPVSFDISVAFTDLQGDQKTNEIFRGDEVQDFDITNNRSIDAQGLSWRATVTYGLDPHWSLYGGYKIQNYLLSKDTDSALKLKSDGLVLGIRYMF